MKTVDLHLDIRTPPDRVIQAFLDPRMLADWWQVERCLVQPKVNGLYTLTWQVRDAGFGYVSSGLIEQYDPSGILVIGNFVYLNPEYSILGPMRLRVQATRREDHSEVFIRQSGYQAHGDWLWYYEAVKQAWPMAGKTLKDYLEQS